MGNISKNLSRSEIQCQDGCGFDTIDFKMVEGFQKLCDYLSDIAGSKVIARIVSGCRCDYHNGKEGGLRNSLHTKGKAIDFEIIGLSSKEVGEAIEQILPIELFDYKYNTELVIHLELDDKTKG